MYIKHCIFRPPFWTPRDKFFPCFVCFLSVPKREHNSSPLKTCLLTLFKEIIFVYTELYRNINYKMQNYWSLKQLVHIVAIRLKRLRTSESPVRRSHLHSCRYTADVHETFRVFQTGSEQPSKHVTLFGMILIKPWPIFPVTVWDKITRDRSEIKGRGRVDIPQGDNALKQVCEN
jgi:hypothetical protein